MDKIEELTGIRRSENRVREFLKRIGMRRRKVGMIPAKADPDEQEAFYFSATIKPAFRRSQTRSTGRLFYDLDSFSSQSFFRVSLGIFPIFHQGSGGQKPF